MRDDSSGWIQLHAGEFFLLWDALGLGEPPAILRVPHLGRTPAERAVFAESAGRALSERGLGTVVDPADDLAEMLRGLAEPEVRLDLHAEGESFAFAAFAAFGSIGRQAGSGVGRNRRDRGAPRAGAPGEPRRDDAGGTPPAARGHR